MDIVMHEHVSDKILGKPFYHNRLPEALRQTVDYVGTSGHVASLPEQLHARVLAPFDAEVWQNWYTANSEEDVGITKTGKKVVAVVHGGGILSSPYRIERAYSEKLTAQYAAKLEPQEITDLLDGQVASVQGEVPVFTYGDILNGKKKGKRNYTIVLDFETTKRTESGHQDIAGLYDNPLFVARAGGVEEAKAFLEKAKQKWSKYGNWHPFSGIDPEESQGRLLFLGYYSDLGLYGDLYMSNYGRFVGERERSEQLAPKAPHARGSSYRSVNLDERVIEALQNGKAFPYGDMIYVPVPKKVWG